MGPGGQAGGSVASRGCMAGEARGSGRPRTWAETSQGHRSGQGKHSLGQREIHPQPPLGAGTLRWAEQPPKGTSSREPKTYPLHPSFPVTIPHLLPVPHPCDLQPQTPGLQTFSPACCSLEALPGDSPSVEEPGWGWCGTVFREMLLRLSPGSRCQYLWALGASAVGAGPGGGWSPRDGSLGIVLFCTYRGESVGCGQRAVPDLSSHVHSLSPCERTRACPVPPSDAHRLDFMQF